MVLLPQSHNEHEEPQRDVFRSSKLEKENPVSKEIVDCAFKIHTSIGPGLMESAYQECMEKEFIKRGMSFKKEYQMPVWYEEERLQTPYRVDFLVEDCIIVELKAVEKIMPVHQAQILTYLKLSDYKMALLINFSSPLIKDGIKRFVL
ncbi:MAG: GxxExxY protein [Alphaproteobacteria bacterium]|nr:GxxExxY protein [Alphaproteobacteria bacterium]